MRISLIVVAASGGGLYEHAIQVRPAKRTKARK